MKTGFPWLFFCFGLFMVQMCRENILLVGKMLCLNTFELSENYFVRKMFDLPPLLISKTKSQYLIY